jgi:hypothetical protein
MLPCLGNCPLLPALAPAGLVGETALSQLSELACDRGSLRGQPAEVYADSLLTCAAAQIRFHCLSSSKKHLHGRIRDLVRPPSLPRIWDGWAC